VVQLQAEQVIDDVESIGTPRIVHAADVDQAVEQAARLIAQIAQEARHLLALDGDGELAKRDLPVRHGVLMRVGEIGAQLFQLFFHDGAALNRRQKAWHQPRCAIDAVRHCRRLGSSFRA
jgi:hypothetical protein